MYLLKVFEEPEIFQRMGSYGMKFETVSRQFTVSFIPVTVVERLKVKTSGISQTKKL